MAEEFQHFSHGCALTSPKIIAYGICNICNKDKPVQFCCNLCKFDLCKACSKLPHKVWHDFHSDHSLEFCLRQYDQKAAHIVCSACGNMSSGSFYKCKECETYLDLDCALMENIFRGWDVKEMLHYSHLHMLRRSRPGPDVEGSSCLLCDLPLSPSTICFGCVHCYLFFHESCLDCPTEIRHHPVHPKHSLRRIDYKQNCGGGRKCNACGDNIVNGPFGCLECGFDLHLRCADSLLRGLLHKSHRHRLFYVATKARLTFSRGTPCQICSGSSMLSLDCFYQCVECDLYFHFECLGIPESVVRKSFHAHPLVCTVFKAHDDSLDYCGVCETVVHAGHHVYNCEKCDFLGHIECILRKVTNMLCAFP